MSNDMLYDFIKKSITKFCPLFYFLDIQKLSEERLLELFESFANSDETSRKHFGYMKCNLEFVMQLVKDKGNLQRKISDLENEKSQIQDKLTKVETEKSKLKELFEQTKKAKSDLEMENSSLKKQLSDIEDEMNPIIGTITARVKSGLLFSAQIKLREKKSSLDKSKSKYIVSTSNAKILGEAAYKSGQPITSLDQETICFGGKAGTYYVRALVFSEEGKAAEIVSNPVTTSGSSIAFGFEGKAVQVALIDGKYKLEVWGAQGGDGGGTREYSSPGKGGLGGYSVGILTLSEVSNMHVLVGGMGVTAAASDGAVTRGGFPDGGDTKTGLGRYTSVPGTGGGSTSIRVSSDTLFTRLIVAGGGGGASGDISKTWNGGCGGGQSGENCSCCQGAGTQVGSTPGQGYGSSSSAGVFGHGATSGYRNGANSGGGGGGGWYGGGSGGHGNNNVCSGGGGGSGWIFTASSFSEWQSGDPSEASHYSLGSQFYLSNAVTIPGNSKFPSTNGGRETGHQGNGYAKITPE